MISQRNFFDSMAEKWDVVSQHDTNKIKFIVDLLRIKKGDKVLDVGTGTGVLVPFLREKVGEKGIILAIDFSPNMIKEAKQKYNFDNVNFICQDVLEDNLPHDYFDNIICYSVFPHFPDKRLAIEKINKYLRKGGKFTIFHSQSRKAINSLHKKASEVVSMDKLPSIDIIEDYFESSGLDTIIERDNDEMFIIVGRK